MYTDDEIMKLREELQIIKDEQLITIDADKLKQLQSLEKIKSSILISKYYRIVNYSNFDIESLANVMADLISVVEDKTMVVDVVFVSKKIGYSKLPIRYANLIIRNEVDDVKMYYDDYDVFKEDIKDKDILVLTEEVGVIPEKTEIFELVKDSFVINKDNMNLENIKGTRLNINLGNREYLMGLIKNLMDYKWNSNKVDINETEMTDVMNTYALSIVDEKNKVYSKMRNIEGI